VPGDGVRAPGAGGVRPPGGGVRPPGGVPPPGGGVPAPGGGVPAPGGGVPPPGEGEAPGNGANPGSGMRPGGNIVRLGSRGFRGRRPVAIGGIRPGGNVMLGSTGGGVRPPGGLVSPVPPKRPGVRRPPVNEGSKGRRGVPMPDPVITPGGACRMIEPSEGIQGGAPRAGKELMNQAVSKQVVETLR